MLGKTVVNIEVKPQPLPAITVCVPGILSIEKLSKFNAFDQKIYQDYMRLVRNYSKISNKTHGNQTIMNELRIDMKNINYRIMPVDVSGPNISISYLN